MPATARLLDIDLPQRQSAFLWGARKTGKSTYLSWSSVASPSRAVSQFGHALEHFILMELAAHASYSELQYDIHFWRTRSGLEVDFILGAGEVAIEVKGSSILRDRELRALHAFVQEYRPRDALVVSTELVEREVGGIRIVPWQIFRSRLWAGEIIA